MSVCAIFLSSLATILLTDVVAQSWIGFQGDFEDSDVRTEKQRVDNMSDVELTLVVRHVNKYYGKLHAVKDLTFGVEPNECFGLLGEHHLLKHYAFLKLKTL